MRPYVLIPILSAIFVGCSIKEIENKFSDKEDISLPLGQSIDFSKVDTNCQSGECAKVTISYPSLKELDKANQFIERSVQYEMLNLIRNKETSPETEVLANTFIKDYQKFKKAFPESSTPWTVDIEAKINLAKPNIISFQINTTSYTGGAHPNTISTFFNISDKGRNQPIGTLITDIARFSKIAEIAFRKSKSLSENADLNEAGFMFEGNNFQLPQNIGFNKKGIILYYNDYEIAPHATGATKIEIPYKSLEGLLSQSVTP